MTKKILSLVIMFLVGASMVFAQEKTEKFEVKGNCGMCEKRIEKAAKSVDGVITADWNQETKMIEVKYIPGKVEIIDIHKAIAEAGHDTDKVEAEDKVYNNLPGCCKYERKQHHKNRHQNDGNGDVN